MRCRFEGLGSVDALMPQGGGGRLERLSGLVNGIASRSFCAGSRGDKPWPAGYPPLTMFKALLLQSLYGLSDKELEEALLDRLSFKRFVGWRWMRRCRIIRRCAATATF